MTHQQVGAPEFAQLAVMHAKLTQLPNCYAQQMEGAYLYRATVQDSALMVIFL